MLPTYNVHSVSQRNARLPKVRDDRTTRVRAYTIDGVQCCPAGIGEGQNRLTLPMCYTVDMAFRSPTWIRFATPEEEAIDGKWYKLLENQPNTLVHSNGEIANPHDYVGMMGTVVQVLKTEHKTAEVFETPVMVSLGDVATPESMSPRSSTS